MKNQKLIKKEKDSYEIIASKVNSTTKELSTYFPNPIKRIGAMNKQVKQQTELNYPKLSTQSYKGARDFFPEDMRIRNYIFDTWRKVCKRYGFEEYDFPILEPYEIFAAKTGEEIVNNQLYNFEDKGGRKIAIRPELTPGTVRMIAQRFYRLERPIKWFMIGNNWRFEKPQKGRGREFYQLEANIFGVESVTADFEIFSLMIDLMRSFGADEKNFCVKYSDRRLINALLDDVLKLSTESQINARRIMDKRNKVSKEEFSRLLIETGLNKEQAETIDKFMNSSFNSLNSILPEEILNSNKGYKGLLELRTLLFNNKSDNYCAFDPSIIRGFDYSDGIVYEVFDKKLTNSRSLFGGERFDRLINIFGDFDLPATGFAMGDYTLLEFLKGWNLLPALSNETLVLVTVFNEETQKKSLEITKRLRDAGINTDLYLEFDKLDKQLKYADRKGFPFVVIVGPDEVKKNKIILKDMRRKIQSEATLEDIVNKLKQ